MARDLYASLQEFYRRHEQYQDRPLYITGEVRGTHSLQQQQQAPAAWPLGCESINGNFQH